MPSLPTPAPAVLLASSFAFVVVQLDVTIVNVALPRIGLELGAGVGALQWVVDAYMLGFAALLLSAGALGDRFGHRRVLLAGFALFAATSAACALAPHAPALNAARAAQGVAAALLVPSSLALLRAAYGHDRQRLAAAVACWTAAGGVAIAAGPLLGGLLLSVAGWRSVFWVNLPICALGFALTRALAEAAPAAPPAGTPRRPFDVAGQLLAIVALVALIGALIEAQSLGQSHPLVRGAALLALLAGAAFVAVERRSAAPMLPLQLFARPGFAAAVLFGVLLNFAYYGVLFVLSFYLQALRHFSALQSGLMFLPLTATFIASNLAGGWMAARAGAPATMVLGGLIGCTGYALLGLLGVSARAGFLDMLPGLALIPAGMGLAVPAMTTVILAGVEPRLAGTASAVLNAARQVGGAAGVALFGAMAAAGSRVEAIGAVRAAMVWSALLLLLAATLAYRCRGGLGAPRPAAQPA
ncbi:MFS transporter, DHA2 family, methylenomycin A resistance protein [Janthinobacterium sp. CG_23.3]|uniref:MFS transporter n=1 Tax=unclassified Janthinobacterium TaxID=2610881 RepID=UPI000345E62D|nr:MULTISPECIES: MFS transporter [unclassified Janthinobacterium]MEC5159687.1 DHA2 family methylenomycin A resistance protein-like MFS transporter [Janthinobacterium sp. CG_S6]